MKKITKKYLEENFIGFDKVSKTKSGTFKIRRGYFYKHGMDEDTWGREVVAQLKKGGIEAKIVKTQDEWRNWPKDSYFMVEIKINQ